MVKEVSSFKLLYYPTFSEKQAQLKKYPTKLSDDIYEVKKYSFKPLKSDKVSFGNVGVSSEKSKFYSKPDNYPVYTPHYIFLDGETLNVSGVALRDRINTNFYDGLSDNIAVLSQGRKNIILSKKDGAKSEYLLHNFDTNVKNGNYSNIGFRRFGTDVFYFDAKSINRNGTSSYEEIQNIVTQNPNRKKVVFVDNFENFIRQLELKSENLEKFFAPGKFYNTQVIGMVAESNLEGIKEGKWNVDANIFKKLNTLDFDPISSSEAKRILLNDARIIEKSTQGFPQKIRFSPKSIIDIVDKSSYAIEGPFPDKAVNVASMVIASKLKDMKSDKGDILVNSADVNKFFNNYYEILGHMKPEQGRFKMAERVNTKLSDVGGIGTIKEEIEDSIIAFLKNPKKYIQENGKAPKGALLTGPPGTGKTYMARGIAGSTNTPFISASGSEFVEQFVGVGAQRVRELFSNARQLAKNSPNHSCIIFIDEIDAIGRARSGAKHSSGNDERESTLNQLLTEMDGFDNKNSKEKIILIAATNRKDILDKALVRAGRFDDSFEVSLPSSIEDRMEILRVHAKKYKFLNPVQQEEVLKEAAILTNGMSGAEIEELLSKASKVVSKRTENKFLTKNDIVEGFLRIISGPINKSNDRSMEDIRKTVRHEGGHAVVIDTLKHDKVSFITLDSRGDFLGMVYKNLSRESPTFKSVIYSAATSHAGGLAEPLYDKMGNAAGVSQDLKNATSIIMSAITEWGQGIFTPRIALNFKNEEEAYNFLVTTYGKEIKKDIDLFSYVSQRIAKMIVDFHKDFLDKYVNLYESNAGKGGNNLTGEEFSKMREEWIKSNGKEKDLAKMLKKIDKIIDFAHKSKQLRFRTLLKFI